MRISDWSSDVCSSDRPRRAHWYHQRTCRLLGIQVERRVEPSRRHPTLYVANHVSYLDIEVLGALLAVSFVAKAEVATWPFFAWLARLQETVFVERRGRHAARHRAAMTRRLVEGDAIVTIPEGTCRAGHHACALTPDSLHAAAT